MSEHFRNIILDQLRRDSKSGLFCRFGEWLNGTLDSDQDLFDAMIMAMDEGSGISANAIYRYAKGYAIPYEGGVSVVKAHCAGQCRCPR